MPSTSRRGAPMLALRPLTDEAWPNLIEDLKSGFAGRLNIYRVMAHDPELLKSWESLRNHLVLDSALTPIQREVVILRAAFRWQSAYEWAHHVSRGRDAGLTEAQISAAAMPLNKTAPDDPDRPFLAAVDALMADGALTPDLVTTLAGLIGKAGLIDLMATVGMYSTLAFIAKTFAVPLEPEVADLDPGW